MTLQETTQILGGLGVIASIFYTAFQLSSNAKAVRAASVQQLNLFIMAPWDELARNRDLVTVMLTGGDDFEKLDRWDQTRVRFFVLARMRSYEIAHF